MINENFYVNVARLMYPKPSKKNVIMEDNKPVPVILVESGEDG